MFLIECEAIPLSVGKDYGRRISYTQIVGVANNFVLMSISERVSMFGRVLEVASQALLEFMSWINSPLGGRQSRCSQWIDREASKNNIYFILSFILFL